LSPTGAAFFSECASVPDAALYLFTQTPTEQQHGAIAHLMKGIFHARIGNDRIEEGARDFLRDPSD
jgi:hypothetical protein